MGWRERLLPASFRGVAFFVSRAVFTGGRAVVVHEFPQREKPYIEDVGRRRREFSLDAYFLGENYDKDLAALRRACEKPALAYPINNESLLRHPYLGDLRVTCTSFRSEEGEQEGRTARVRLTFVESGDKSKPTPVVNPPGQAAAAGAALEADVGTTALGELQLSAVPAAVTESVVAEVESLGKTLAGLDIFSGPAKEAAAQAAKISSLINEASALATSPLELVGAIQDALTGIAASTSSALGALYAYEAVLGSPSSTSTADAATSTIGGLSASNTDQFAGVVSASALSGAVTAAASVTWASLDDALEVRSRLNATLDARMAVAGDSEFSRLENVRSALVASVPPPGRSLPRLSRVTLSAPIPAIALSYQLFDSPNFEGDIVARNKVENETFVPAGVELEVLSDARRS